MDDHGGNHDFSASAEEAECILYLMMPERIPLYDGPVSLDLIEIIQKKAAFYVELMDDELLTVGCSCNNFQ